MNPGDIAHRRRWQAWNAFVVIATAVVALYIGLSRPAYNWDVIGYLAAAHDVGGISDAALSRKTFGELKAAVGGKRYAQLTRGTSGVDPVYRSTVFRHPASLAQQVPFYATKWLYVMLMRGLGFLGMGYVKASYAISAVCAALGVGLVFLHMRRWRLPAIALPFVIAYCGMATVGTLSTPDAMAALFSLAAFYLVAMRHRAAYALVAMLPLVRPELVILSMLLFAFLAAHHDARWSAWGAATSAALYLFIAVAEHGYGYAELFNVSFIHRSPYPAGMHLSTHVRDYLLPYARLGVSALHHPVLACFGLAAIVLWQDAGRRRLGSEGLLFLAIPTAYTLVHVLLFPVFRVRFFTAEAAIVLTCLLSMVGMPKSQGAA